MAVAALTVQVEAQKGGGAMSKRATPNGYETLGDASRELRVTTQTLRNWIKAGDVRSIEQNGFTLVWMTDARVRREKMPKRSTIEERRVVAQFFETRESAQAYIDGKPTGKPFFDGEHGEHVGKHLSLRDPEIVMHARRKRR